MVEKSPLPPGVPSFREWQDAKYRVDHPEEFPETADNTSGVEVQAASPAVDDAAADDENFEIPPGVPVFVTNKMRAELRAYGYSDEKIDGMKPAVAWRRLQEKKNGTSK